MLRRNKEVNNDYLPPKEEYIVFCKPTPKQLSLYHQFLKAEISTATPLKLITVLKNLCNSVNLCALAKPRKEDASRLKSIFTGKIEVLLQLLEYIKQNTKDKVVIVANSTKLLDELQSICDDKCYPFSRLDGKTPVWRRQQQVAVFNLSASNEKFLFLLSAKAGGAGLNLYGANRLIMFDIDWNPAIDQQAMARIWRDKQLSKVYIYRLLTTGTIEGFLMDL
jgi:DNA repair and recombination protein RAD54B